MMPKKSNVDIKPPERKPSPSGVEKIGMPHPDKVRLDFLERIAKQGECSVFIHRLERGNIFLTTSSRATGAVSSIRRAIDNFMQAIEAAGE